MQVLQHEFSQLLVPNCRLRSCGEHSRPSFISARFHWILYFICSSCVSLHPFPVPRPGLIVFDSMRYGRMLEESSFANKKADYFWLLLLSSLMLLVCDVGSKSRISLTYWIGSLIV